MEAKTIDDTPQRNDAPTSTIALREKAEKRSMHGKRMMKYLTTSTNTVKATPAASKASAERNPVKDCEFIKGSESE